MTFSYCEHTPYISHPVLVLDQHMVEAADRHEEHDDLYIVKDVDPLLPLRPLSSYVKHAVCQVANLKNGLANPSRS